MRAGLWSEAGAGAIDLTPYSASGQVTLTHIVERAGEDTPRAETAPANAVPVEASPVFVAPGS